MKDSCPPTLKELRKNFTLQLPELLRDLSKISFEETSDALIEDEIVNSYFPKTSSFKPLKAISNNNLSYQPLKVGVVFSGGQASGGHNVISGLYDGLKELNKDSILYGFLGGPSGILTNKHILISESLLLNYRNQGGFDLIGSGRTKIETKQQMSDALETMKVLGLHGLLIIGGDDSNTNAAILAEFFLDSGIATRVIGVPKTIDGDLKNSEIEVSFGFDTACKVYSEIIGNIAKDCISSKKYYHFIKLMGRSASHIALECALKTHANMVFISEEVQQKKKSLKLIVQELADLIEARSNLGKNFGVILIPEGLIEFISEFKVLIADLNALLAKQPELDHETILPHLSKFSLACFQELPELIQKQLTLDRDPHGNVQVSLIETERMLIEMVKKELKKRKEQGTYNGKFLAISHFLGYEGRCAFPSNFDSTYCYALGKSSAALIANGLTGYIVSIKNLIQKVDKWQIFAFPLVKLVHFEDRKGEQKPVIKKALVDLLGNPFKNLVKERKQWEIEDSYQSPGPIQYFGEDELTYSPPLTLKLEKSS